MFRGYHSPYKQTKQGGIGGEQPLQCSIVPERCIIPNPRFVIMQFAHSGKPVSPTGLPPWHVRRERGHFYVGKLVDQSKNAFLADLPHSSRATAPTRRRDQPGRILRMPARRCRRLPIGQTPVRSRNPEGVQANLSKGWQGDKPFGFVGPACGPDCRRLKSKI